MGDHHHARFGHDRSSGVGYRRVYIHTGYDLDLEKWCAPSLGGDHHHARFGHDRSSGVGCRRVYIYI